jgi:hypothetical protein
MDVIFRKCRSIFSIVKVAKEEPHWFDKKGELLIQYQETEEHFRRASVISERRVSMAAGQLPKGKSGIEHLEKDEERAENGFA